VTRAALALGAALCAACISLHRHLDLPVRDEAHVLPPTPEPEAEPYQTSDGSLWRGEQSRRFLAFENRATRTGDLVTVQIQEQAHALTQATTDVNRTGTFQANLNSAVALQTLVTRPILGVLRFFGFTDQRNNRSPNANLQIADATTNSKYKGDGSVQRQSNFTTTIACLVTEVTPSGLLRIEGKREITINREQQLIRVSGYVRPEDVQIDNTVSSALIANANIEYGGQGVVSDKQRVPWLTRLFELILPF
jgi:flagellar L-ring protein precursor FlgH